MTINKTFVLAGDATFTVELPPGSAQPHYTYRVQKTEATPRYPQPGYFVKLLTGPDNEGDYSYLGKLDENSGAVILTAKSKLPPDAFPVRLFNRICNRIWLDDCEAYEQHGYRVHHEGRCGRCGRKLTVPESVETGIGPECAEIMGLGGFRTPKARKPRKAPKAEPVATPTPHQPAKVTAGHLGLGKSAGKDHTGGFLSDGAGIEGLTPHIDAEGEITHWYGQREGQNVVVFND